MIHNNIFTHTPSENSFELKNFLVIILCINKTCTRFTLLIYGHDESIRYYNFYNNDSVNISYINYVCNMNINNNLVETFFLNCLKY